jgi:hypothetical protein
MPDMAVIRWMKSWFDSRPVDTDIDDEVCFHLEMRADSYRRAGMSEEDAVELANKQFGDTETIKRAMRGARVHPLYAMSAGLACLAIVLVAVWLYDSSLSSELPSLPPGMKFVGGPPKP